MLVDQETIDQIDRDITREGFDDQLEMITADIMRYLRRKDRESLEDLQRKIERARQTIGANFDTLICE